MIVDNVSATNLKLLQNYTTCVESIKFLKERR